MIDTVGSILSAISVLMTQRGFVLATFSEDSKNIQSLDETRIKVSFALCAIIFYC